jgi:hypothetical protein
MIFHPGHPHALFVALGISIYDGLARAIPKTLGLSLIFSIFAPQFRDFWRIQTKPS